MIMLFYVLMKKTTLLSSFSMLQLSTRLFITDTLKNNMWLLTLFHPLLLHVCPSSGALCEGRWQAAHGQPPQRQPGRRTDTLHHPARGRPAPGKPPRGALRRLPTGRLQPGPPAAGPSPGGCGDGGHSERLQGVRTATGDWGI